MRKLGTLAAEAWPISRVGTNGHPILEKVIIASDHTDGEGKISLSPDQLLYVQSRLSHITMAFLDGHEAGVQHFGTDHLPDDPVQQLRACRARVWPITHETEELPPTLEKVVVQAEHPDGAGMVHLSPEQAKYVYARLTHISMAFLHENAWGGEDARRQ